MESLLHGSRAMVDRAYSGAECVGALRRAGFRVKHQGDGVTVLERGYRAVVVAALPTLNRNALISVLSAAGIAWADFVVLADASSPNVNVGSGIYPRYGSGKDPSNDG